MACANCADATPHSMGDARGVVAMEARAQASAIGMALDGYEQAAKRREGVKCAASA